MGNAQNYLLRYLWRAVILNPGLISRIIATVRAGFMGKQNVQPSKALCSKGPWIWLTAVLLPS